MGGSAKHGAKTSKSSKSTTKTFPKSKNKQERSGWEESEQFQVESRYTWEHSGEQEYECTRPGSDEWHGAQTEPYKPDESKSLHYEGSYPSYESPLRQGQSISSPRQDVLTPGYQMTPVEWPYPPDPPTLLTTFGGYVEAEQRVSFYQSTTRSQQASSSNESTAQSQQASCFYKGPTFSPGTWSQQSSAVPRQDTSTLAYLTASGGWLYQSNPPISSDTFQNYPGESAGYSHPPNSYTFSNTLDNCAVAGPGLSPHDRNALSRESKTSYRELPFGPNTSRWPQNSTPGAYPQLGTASCASSTMPSTFSQQQRVYSLPNTSPWTTDNLADESVSRISALRLDDGTSEVQDDSEFTIIANPEGYFKPGRIFITIWTETGSGPNEAQIFVVMSRYKHLSSVCCRLQHYSVINHSSAKTCALVFAAGSSPILFPEEEPPGMGEFPVVIEKPDVAIDPALRLDFSKTYTVNHHKGVRTVGRIDRKCLKMLESAFLKAKEANISENEASKVVQESYYSKPDYTSTDDLQLPTENLNQSSQPPLPIAPAKIGHNTATSKNRSISFASPSTSSEPLHEDFQIRSSYYFKKGAVFKVLWSEPLGSSTWNPDNTDPTDEIDEERLPSKYREEAYHSIRRFVIAKASRGHCICVPILTYGRRGTTKPGVKPEHHAIIYSTLKAPQPIRGERGIFKKSIRMVPTTKREGLDPSSRLNYNKVYTVEHNVKVCFIGELDKHSLGIFSEEFRITFERDE